jgi:hypothetical protein
MLTSYVVVIILISVVLPVAIIVFVRAALFGNTRGNRARAQELMSTGNKARAMILRVDPTGVIVNHINLQCIVQFQMEPLDGSPSFQAQQKTMINQTAMPRVGDVWPAWYDPSDLTCFSVGMPDGASPDQIPLFREFGIRHPLDTSAA